MTSEPSGAEIVAVEYALPAAVVTNDDLDRQYPHWNMPGIYQKTGVRERHVAAPGECASDLAERACRLLFERHGVPPDSIDGLIVCTQSPDYIMPPTSTLLQSRLGLSKRVAAFDYTLACSGYPYGLAMCKGFIEAGILRRILLVTCDTYSKYIRHDDRATRTLFGDGAAATLVCRGQPGIGAVRMMTDGSGGQKFIVRGGGCRNGADAGPAGAGQPASRFIEMDGYGILTFVNKEIPPFVHALLDQAGLTREQVDLYLFHQASRISLEQVCRILEISSQQTYTNFENTGNTVSSSIPIAVRQAWAEGRIRAGMNTVLVGFGVGLSWAGAVVHWTEPMMAGCRSAAQGEK